MGAPIFDMPKCDVKGCCAPSEGSSDGTEIDHLGRKAIPGINYCGHHKNFPHSEDALSFTLEYPDKYKARIAGGSK